MTNLDFLKKAVSLAEENPELLIHICVDGDEVLEFGWTSHIIHDVKVGYWIRIEGRIFTDLESAIDEIFDNTEENKDAIRSRLQNKKAILIYTEAD